MKPHPYTTNLETCGRQKNTGPTTRSRKQAPGLQEQGAKHDHQDGEESGRCNFSRLMQMVRELRKKKLDITLPAEI